MKLKKIKDTFNDYNMEISWGQLQAIKTALESSPDPVSDELLQEISWYCENVAGPGESEEELKAREEGTPGEGAASNGNGKPGTENDEPAEDDDDGVPIPMPPREKGDYRETVAGEGPEEPGGEEDLEPGPRGRGEPPARSNRPGGEDREGLPSSEDEEEEALPAPPRE